MALGASNRANFQSAADATSYNVSVSAPNSDCWLVIDVFSRHATVNPNLPTLSGGGLTYTPEANVLSATVRRLSRTVAKITTSPGAYTLVADFAGQTQTQCMVHVTEITGGDTSDILVNGNSLTNTGTGVTSGSVTLGAFADAGDRPLLAIAVTGGVTITPEATELAEATAGENITLETSWDAAVADLTPSASWGVSDDFLAIASELRIVSGGGSTTLDPFGMSGFFGG